MVVLPAPTKQVGLGPAGTDAAGWPSAARSIRQIQRGEIRLARVEYLDRKSGEPPCRN